MRLCYLIATAFPSEGLPQEMWYLAWFSLIASTVAFLIGLVLLVSKKSTIGAIRGFGVGAILVGLYAPLFALYLYKLDSVAVEWEGTKASNSLLNVLLIPSLPVLGGFLLAIFANRARLAEEKVPPTQIA